MADNITLQSSTLASPAAATVFATDDVSSVHYPISKLAYGALESVTLVSTSNGFPVQPASSTTWTVDSELPAAAALADNTANPTAPAVASFPHVYDGSTWDRWTGAVTQSGTWNIGTVTTVTTVATVTSITNAVTIQDGGNTITVDNGGTFAVQAAQSGSWTVDTELPAAAALADNTANPTVPGVGAFMMVYDGSTWDRFTGSMTMSGAVDTELPAAAALADNTSNPTAPAVGSFPHWWDGATWDRAPGTAADGALVNLGSNNDVTVTGTVTANAGSGTFTVDSELPAAAALADNASNPTCPAVGAFLMLWDGATWDRGKGDSTDGALVNLGANNDVTCTQSGTWNIGTVTTVTTVSTVTAVTTITNAVTVVGNAAEDAALSGNPVRTGVRASRAVPTSMSADGDVVTPWADREGRQVTKQQSGTGTQTSVSGSASNVTLLAANTQRLGASIYNDSSATLYVRFQATATTSNFSVKMFPDDYCEVPAGYTGIIDGIWSSATGSARVTEYT